MKAILLAAGEGKRMRPLTLETPKCMTEVLGRPLLEYIIESLPVEVNEIILVIGYKGEQIKKHFGNSYAGRSIYYVWQEKPLGTGHALHLCKHLIGRGERFMFMLADDLHSPAAIERLMRHGLGVLVREHPEPRKFGVLEVDAHGKIIGIEEKPEKPKSNLVAVGVYIFDSSFFDYPMPISARGEYEYVSPLLSMIAEKDVFVEKTDFWHPIGYPHDVASAENVLCARGVGTRTPYSTPVIIIAGGKGTRLPAEEQDKPKCLVAIAGKPLLQHQFDILRAQGFSNITLSLGHKAEMVVEWLKESGNTSVKYVIEKESMGTGGGLRLAAGMLKEPFIAFNCDDLADVDFASTIRHSCGGKYNVIVGTKFNAAHTFDSLVCDEYKRVCEFRQRSNEIGDALVNIGHYYLRPDIFEGMPERFSNEKDLFPKLAKEGKLVLQTHTGYWLTANNAEQIAGAREFFRSITA